VTNGVFCLFGFAVGAVIIAVLALSLGDAIIKATGLDLPLWQMYILRSVLVLPPLFWLARRNGYRAFGSLFWVVVRSALLVAMWLSYYSALPLMPLSLAAAAYYTSPILITVVASVLALAYSARAVCDPLGICRRDPDTAPGCVGLRPRHVVTLTGRVALRLRDGADGPKMP